MPPSGGTGRLEKAGRFGLKNLSYDGAADAYICPAGQLLRPMKGRWTNTSGRVEIRYASRTRVCRACRLRTKCLTPMAPYRTIARWEHEAVLERHHARMQGAAELMRRRSAIVEHPFGMLKCRAGYRHFLVRGFDKVRGEWSLMALCYNFTRVLNILAFEDFGSTCRAFRFASGLMSVICPSQCGVSRHQSERGRLALLSRSRYPSAGIARGTERRVRPDAPQSAAAPQIQKRLALEAEFDPSPKHALGSHVFQSVSLPQSSPRISRARRRVSWTAKF